MKMAMLLPLLIFFFCLSTNLNMMPAHPSYHSDEHALLSFKAAISVDPFNLFLHWSPNQIICNWTGITCSSRRQRVVSLNISNMGLYGKISPFLGNLSFLRVLDLQYNSFQDHIPYQLGGLMRLRYLRLSYNNLSGSIPPEFSLLPTLEVMVLVGNQLTGIIPPFLGNMSFLKVLGLSDNELQGGIPAELGMLTQLTWLKLGRNILRIGSIPLLLLNFTHLQKLDLSACDLKGPIPRELGRLSELQKVLLWQNELSGEIPRSVGNLTYLEVLELEINQLSGTVPLEIGNLQKLRNLNLWANQLVSGSNGLSIITVLTNCSTLVNLGLLDNHFTGVLPTSVGRLSISLSFLNLAFNEIAGNIPEEIANLTNLSWLDLRENRLNGTIPSALGKLPKLERLFLDTNNLQGRIPESLGQLKRLGLLSLSKNMLSGQVPDSLGELPQLRRLHLDHNQLSDRIPANLGRCQTLELVDFAYNRLTGNLPPEVAGLQNLHIYFNISNNFLQGSISEMSKLVMALAIDVSQNNFSGVIPAVLASCQGLEYLNLSGNAFEGPIPASLADLRNLQYMDLSCNNLSGMIPMTFTKMKMLQHLNLSSNRLTGEVPKGGAFATLDASEIMGNLGLCGGWINLPPCSHSSQKKTSISKKVIISTVVGIGILIMSVLLVAFSYVSYKHFSTPALKLWPPKFSYNELVDATAGFSDENLIGIGSFGSVYKGILKSGTNIAVKVLNLQDGHAHQSFTKECNALKRVRHRNVIKIISACSNLDFKALILPFMSNGSLERWLYNSEGVGCTLKLSDRLRIAIEIAQGLAYLHHYCFVQVIHCDLKPSNVLLGDDMTAYIADFGISNIFFGNSIESLSSTSALKGSIGYIAPEYGTRGKISTKGDVYSYGILILELLTRRRPTDNMFTEGLNLQKWTEINFPSRTSDVVDNYLLIDGRELDTSTLMECLTQFIQIGLFCTRESPQERPNMIEIVGRLNTIRATFLGTSKTPQLPIDISPFLDNTRGTNMAGSRNKEGSSTSTS